MKLVKHFNDFLNETVNIDEDRLELLDSRVGLISSFLESAPVIGEAYIDVIPQGSMAHRTIIKPFNNHEFDADVLLQLVPQDDWLAKDYVQELYTAFRTSDKYKDRVSRNSRCVTVKYANDCHIDVVPFLELQPNTHYITNRNEGEDGEYELTDPTGYTEWLDSQNRIANGNLVKAIRLLKWLRDYKQTFTCKSVVLTVLLGQRINSANLLSDEKYYADLPTTLVHLLEDLRDYLADFPELMPLIADPTCEGVDYNHRWDNDQYLNFRNRIEYYASKARAAYDEEDRSTSIALWQELFGTDFAKSVSSSKGFNLNNLVAQGRKKDPGEMFIEDMFPSARTGLYRLKIRGTVLSRDGNQAYYPLASRGNRVEKERRVKFAVQSTNVPGSYDTYWKIKNYGKEATDAGCLRGEIVEEPTHTEPTAYRGSHYVECYIIKDDVCVARDRQKVIIT